MTRIESPRGEEGQQANQQQQMEMEQTEKRMSSQPAATKWRWSGTDRERMSRPTSSNKWKWSRQR